MWDLKKSVNLSLFITYMCILALAVISILMPWVVTWYVETMGRNESLPTFIMVTYYPCVPFLAVTLWSLRAILKNVRIGNIFTKENMRHMRVASTCCLIVALICFVGGFYYNPFYLVSGSMAFFFLTSRISWNILACAEQKEEKNEKNQ